MAMPAMYYPYPLGGTPNGRYRSTTQATSCSATGASYIYAGTGITTTAGTSTWVTVTVITDDGTGGATGRTYAHDPSTGAVAPATYTPVPATSPTFEDAGVKAGEIIGYRAWWLRNDTLYSMYMDSYAWTPGGVEQASSLNQCRYGIHAFKHAGSALATYAPCARRSQPIVLGEIAMWGEVYEHEYGYRAEFAALRKIYGIVRTAHSGEPGVGRRRGLWPRTTELEILRKRYGVVE